MADEPQTTDPEEPAETEPGNPADTPAGEPRTFSQSDLDRIVQDRLKRQKEQFAGYEDLKAKAAKFDELEASQRTELEQAQARAADLESRAATAEQSAREALLRSAVVAEAARKNVVDPDAAVALIDRDSLELDEHGAPTNIADAMDTLLKTKPYLVGGGTSRGNADLGARGGAGAGQLGSDVLKNMTPEQIVQARKEGKFDSLLKGQTT